MAVETLSCPKCGFEQGTSLECQHCGIIFDRYKPPAPPAPEPLQILPEAKPVLPEANLLKKSLRIARWTAIPVGGIAVALMLGSSPPPQVRVDHKAGQRVELKMQKLQYASDLGRPILMEFDESEVNAWLRAGLSLDAPEGRPPQGNSSIRDLRVQLLEDRLRAYLLLNFHGAKMLLMMEGRPSVVDNHLRFTPISGKLGFLPLPSRTLKKAARRVFEAPDNVENFLLPSDVASVRVEDNTLIISSFH